MLENSPKLKFVRDLLDRHLAEKHPSFFGEKPTRPVAKLKPYKVIHDPFWGTNRFTWRELVLIDSPFFQRLRNIHQTGLAYYVYPSARQSRFEHSLGVLTIASRIFDSLFDRYARTLETIAKEVAGEQVAKDKGTIGVIGRLKQELRLAALLHDTGHSLFSHASERVYSKIPLLKEAAEELTELIGKEKGSGEVISFCLAQTKAVASLLERARNQVASAESIEGLDWNIDLTNVGLLIVGSARHPSLQFLGDIVSSGLDADKLDYFLRDAASAGLPLKYDLERYLYTVSLEKDYTVDPDGHLSKLYECVGSKVQIRPPAKGSKEKNRFPFVDTYRLRLPKKASNTMEQIVICKIMLYSYIYHHQKVRAAEGLLEHLLNKMVSYWRAEGTSDEQLIVKFMDLDDHSLYGKEFLETKYPDVNEISYRLGIRILPREVYRLSSAVSHSEGQLIQEYFLMLKERDKRSTLLVEFEKAIGEQILSLDPKAGASCEEVLWKFGVWVDAPKPPQVEEVELSTGTYPTVTIENIFPVEEWTEAYQAHRYFVRIYAFSEYVEIVEKAGRAAIEQIIGIKTDDFFQSSRRSRN